MSHDKMMKTFTEFEGKKAKGIYWNNGDSETAKDGKEIILTTQYHGEYDLSWFVVMENGLETKRHNAKFIETVVWEDSK